MKEVKIKNGVVIVDDEDLEKVVNFPWRVSTKGYAVYSSDSGKSYQMLHNVILNVPNGSGVDHINRNKLDNRKSNLRFAHNYQQGQNRDLNPNNTSGFKGVSFNKTKLKFQASIKFGYEQKHLGYYNTAEEAAAVYNQAARLYFGENAYFNPI